MPFFPLIQIYILYEFLAQKKNNPIRVYFTYQTSPELLALAPRCKECCGSIVAGLLLGFICSGFVVTNMLSLAIITSYFNDLCLRKQTYLPFQTCSLFWVTTMDDDKNRANASTLLFIRTSHYVVPLCTNLGSDVGRGGSAASW